MDEIGFFVQICLSVDMGSGIRKGDHYGAFGLKKSYSKIIYVLDVTKLLIALKFKITKYVQKSHYRV